MLDQFRTSRDQLLEQQAQIIALYEQRRLPEAVAMLTGSFTENWSRGRKTLNAMVDFNKGVSESSTNNIGAAVTGAKLTMLVSLLLAVVAAVVCGVLLMRAITQPVQRVVETLRTLAGGDLTARLNLGR